jgi:hypothetical protein
MPVRAAALVPTQTSYATLLSPPPTFTNEEVVGVVPGTDTCPVDNADWSGGDVFDGTFVPDPSGRRFCAYQWIGSGTPNIATLPKYCPSGKNCEPCPRGFTCAAPPAGHQWLEPSHRGLYAAGLPDDAREIIASRLEAQHAQAIGAPATMPSGSVPNPNGWWFPYALPTWFTKVYVLDDGGMHGDTVERWIKQTACPSGQRCPWIERRDVFEEEEPLGSVITLAKAIVDAADESVGLNPIINLSVGFHWRHAWTARPNSNDDVAGANIRFAHAALEAAINYAGCRGALVVAAAGNKDGGAIAEDAGPRYFGGSGAFPAAFSEIDDGWTCNASPERAYRKLVVAVGAINADGTIPATAREHGKSCIVAPSTAVTPNGDPLEGSSFATATITGVLANLRSYMPSASNAEVVSAMTSQMEQVPSAPPHRLCYDWVMRMSRVNQCKAIQGALQVTCSKAGTTIASQYGFACDLAAQMSCGTIGTVPRKLSVEATDADRLSACVEDPTRRSNRSFSAYGTLPASAECGVSTVHSEEGDRNPYSCPADVFESGQIGGNISTAPNEPGCGCSVYLSRDRSLWLVGSLLSSSILSPALRLTLSNGGSNVSYFAPLPEEALYELGNAVSEPSGSGLSIQLMGELPEGTTLESAEFSFMTDNGTPQAYSSLLPVIEATD